MFLNKKIRISTVLVVSLLCSNQSFSETAPLVGSTPPESKFGSSPSKPDAGQSSFFSKTDAKTAADDLDMPGDVNADTKTSGLRWQNALPSDMAERAPAGLVYEKLDRNSRVSKGLNLDSEITRKGVQEVSLIASDLGFFPKRVFVNKEIPVRIYVTGASKNTLCLMMDSYDVKKQVRSGKIEEVTFTPSTAGIYRFYCPVNGMEGKLVVREVERKIATAEDEPNTEVTRNSLGEAKIKTIERGSN